MHLSTKTIEEFKYLYQKELGVELSDDEAAEEAIRLLRLWRLLTQ